VRIFLALRGYAVFDEGKLGLFFGRTQKTTCQYEGGKIVGIIAMGLTREVFSRKGWADFPIHDRISRIVKANRLRMREPLITVYVF
jgi:hypothetical protein